VKMIELFCGTGVVSRAFRDAGYDTLTVDSDPRFCADIIRDVLKLYPKHIPKRFHEPHVIWASPPCTFFSKVRARYGWGWKKEGGVQVPTTREARHALKLVKHTLYLIGALKPTYFFIENPVGALRGTSFMKNRFKHTITYCQYGDFRQKRTDIWTNCFRWEPRPACRNGDPCHDHVKKGVGTGAQRLTGSVVKAIIPRELAEEIVEACGKPPREEWFQ